MWVAILCPLHCQLCTNQYINIINLFYGLNKVCSTLSKNYEVTRCQFVFGKDNKLIWPLLFSSNRISTSFLSYLRYWLCIDFAGVIFRCSLADLKERNKDEMLKGPGSSGVFRRSLVQSELYLAPFRSKLLFYMNLHSYCEVIIL